MNAALPRPLIVGTAGHIDHGKSSLVLALTGTDPDRLKEEKERGITTDIGFAHTLLASGAVVSFVDVPGHERFVRNMLAGVHGIDAVLLVVASDESVMPQTREHFAICALLAVRQGIVVLTKSDLVHRDMLAVVRSEVVSLAAGSFLEGAPIVPVSVRTGEGLDELRSRLEGLASAPPSRNAEGLLRLPVDRAFTLRGFGTVVTGTLVGGRLRAGDAVLILPSGRRSRVRGIQVHGQAVESVSAGHRAAVNLADVTVADIARGDVLARERTLAATTLLDAELSMLKSARPAKDHLRVRVHAGSAEVLGRIGLLEGDSVSPGSRALVRLRLEGPAVATRGDRLVLRTYSPPETIAGAVVLDPLPPRRRRSEAGRRPALAVAVTEAVSTFVGALLEEAGPAGIAVDELVARAGLPAMALEGMLAGDVGAVRLEGCWISRTALEGLAAAALQEIDRFHSEAPLKAGMPREELRSRLFAKAGSGAFEAVLHRLALSGDVRAEGDSICRAGHAVKLSPAEASLKERLEAAARDAGLQGIEIAALGGGWGADQAALRRIARVLVESGALKAVGESALVLSEHLDALKATVRQRVRSGGTLDVADVKSTTGLSRKYVIPLLEFLDRERVTRRTGNTRVLLPPSSEKP